MKRTRAWIMGMAGGILGFVLFLTACSKSGKSDDKPAGGSADTLLVNLGANLIVPSFQALANSSAALDAAVTAFNTNPNTTTLASAQQSFKDAYKAWAGASPLIFGPAADAYLTTQFVNSFPTDTTLIKANAGGKQYNIDAVGNLAAQGFPALDYLLFAYGNDASLARFTTDANAAGAKQYLAALSASLKTKTAAVVAAWTPSGGNYLDKFSKGTGTDAGSSLSLLANAFILDFDVVLQNYKVGIPIGIYGGNPLPKSPAKVEAYYSGLSVDLLVAQVTAMTKLYLGGAGGGLDDKVAASNAQSSGKPLNDVIKAQWQTLLSRFQALPSPLSAGIQNSNPAIDAAYTEIRKMTVYLKVDMSSALGIKISFQDDDGD